MYTVYKIINKLTDEYYIGVHKTEIPNDYYMGSGLRIRRAIKKYGISNFLKIVLFNYDCKKEAYLKEVEILKECLNDNKCLNLSKGGVGGANFEGKNILF